MILRGTNFGHVFNASGARGFYKEGYWWHKFVPGLSYDYSTFVSKTTTLLPRAGNMAITKSFRPRALMPDCIVVKPLKGVVLNAVGLSGPGMEALVNKWVTLPMLAPWVISIMSTAKDPDQRAAELMAMLDLVWMLKTQCFTRVAVQINLSCPNVGLDPSHLVEEITTVLDYCARYRPTHLTSLPIMVKLNALVRPSTAADISQHHCCDAIVCSNTIPWGQLPRDIDWVDLFGVDNLDGLVSPLAKYGGGGLSGLPLLPIVARWVAAARVNGLTKPVVAGGGVLSKAGAEMLLNAGADAIELGSVSILRPWRVQGIIDYVNNRFKKDDDNAHGQIHQHA